MTGEWPRRFSARPKPMYGKRSPCDPQHEMTMRLRKTGPSAADDEVHDTAAHVDRTLHALTREMLADVRVGLCDRDDLGLLRLGGDRDLAAHLAVDLHGDLEHLGLEQRGIGGRPRVIGE